MLVIEKTYRWKLPNWLRMSAVATIAFVGGLGGMFWGHELFGEPDIVIAGPGFGPSNHYLTEKYVSFEAGDLFPLEDYTDLNGQAGNFEQLLRGKASIIMFVSFDCSRCFDLLAIWQEYLSSRLFPEVQVIAALNNEFDGIPVEYMGLFKGFQVVTVDKNYWAETYQVSLWPTLVGVDGSGFVVHVQPGFRDYIDYQLINYFLESNQ